MPLAETLALTSLALNVLVAVIGLTWGIGRVRDTVKDEIEQNKEAVNAKIEGLRLNTGEMGISIRQKITEVELHVRDHFVRRDSFDNFVTLFNESIKAQFARLDKRLERMEEKMDQRGNTNGG